MHAVWEGHARYAEEAAAVTLVQAWQVDMALQGSVVVNVADVVAVEDAVDDGQVNVLVNEGVPLEHTQGQRLGLPYCAISSQSHQ